MSSSGEVIAEYLAHLEREGYSVATLAANERWLSQLEASAGDLLRLSAADLTDFQQRLRWQPGPAGRIYSGNSVNQAVDVVRRFYRWAVATGHLGRDPAAHLLTQRVASKPRRELSLEESRTLLSQPNPQTFYGARDRAILALIIEHRLPFKALARLELSHFHYDTGAIFVSGRRAGILSVSDGLADDLMRYLSEARPGVAKAEEPALFVGRDGGRMSDVSFRAILDRHAQAAGLGKLRSSS